MHRFMRAIGFSNINNRSELDKLLGIVMEKADKNRKIVIDEENTYAEMSMEFAANTGITICGEYDKFGFFHLEHYYPYCKVTAVSSQEEVSFNKRVDTSAYTGMCDDMRLGISMIFYLQNTIDYIERKLKDNISYPSNLSLSGLSLNGCIILGIDIPEDIREKKRYEDSQKKQLMIRAKNGDQDAIDSLTIDEIDLSARLNKRIKYQDLYSIVNSSFIPYGSESDNYSILGTILRCDCMTNPYTGEEIYSLLINCNDILMNICINKKDLIGEPLPGRRFKGTIWMQGYVDFSQSQYL